MEFEEDIEHPIDCLRSFVSHNSDSSKQYPKVRIRDCEDSDSVSHIIVTHILEDVVDDIELQKITKSNVVVKHPGRGSDQYLWVLIPRLQPPFDTIRILLFYQPFFQYVEVVRFRLPEPTENGSTYRKTDVVFRGY